MSCTKDVATEDAKIFASVFCCPGCHETAKRFMERADNDLKYLRIMLEKAVRQGLLEGKLQFAAQLVDNVSSKDIVSELADLVRKAKVDKCQVDKTHSGQNMRQPARLQAVSGKSDFNST